MFYVAFFAIHGDCNRFREQSPFLLLFKISEKGRSIYLLSVKSTESVDFIVIRLAKFIKNKRRFIMTKDCKYAEELIIKADYKKGGYDYAKN